MCGKSMVRLSRLNRLVNCRPCVHFMQIRNKCENAKGVVIGLYKAEGDKDPQLTDNGEKFDDRVSGKISDLVRETGMNGELGIGRMFSNVDKEFSCIAVVGLGTMGAGIDEEETIDEGLENTRIASAVGCRALQRQGVAVVHVDGMDHTEEAAEGAALGVWRYNANLSKQNRMLIPKLELFGSTDVDAWTRGLFKAESQNLARRLTDTPANQMSPSIFAQATIDALCPCGVSVQVRSMDWIEEMKLNSFIAIAKGSCEPPIILEVSYVGSSPEDKPILLMGKGITYNSGGLCLKPKKRMDLFRASVSGAAVCVSAIRAAAALSLPINVTAMLPLCESMPSGMAVKPGDLVTLLNGQTMCIKNPSLGGVVSLADPLIYAQNSYHPKFIVDVGTFATGVECGLGASSTGLWSNNKELWQQFEKAGMVTGDRVWRMPLWKYFKSLIQPTITADICNRGQGPATSCIAAAILHQCVPCLDWVHLDSRGTGMLCEHNVPPYLLKSQMSGRPTRTVIQFLYQMACK